MATTSPHSSMTVTMGQFLPSDYRENQCTPPLTYHLLLGQAICQNIFSQELTFEQWSQIYQQLLTAPFFNTSTDSKKPSIYHHQYWHYYHGDQIMIVDHRGQTKVNRRVCLAVNTQPPFQVRCYQRFPVSPQNTLLGTIRQYDHQETVHKFTFFDYAADVKITAEIVLPFPSIQLSAQQLLAAANPSAKYQMRLETANPQANLAPYLQLLLASDSLSSINTV